MPQRMYTGAMGAGKTLLVMTHLLEEVKLNMKRPKGEQRKIYADITGLRITGIEPPPLDWRETPPGSLLIYDEAQLHKEFQETRGLSPYEYIQEITLIRKHGHEIWYITQTPKRLHSNITDLIHEHYHLERRFGAELATIYFWSKCETTPRGPTAQERAENKYLFNYDKSLYDFYDSAQVEDDGFKIRIPWKLALFACLPLLLFGFAAYMYFSPSSQKMIHGTDEPPEQVEQVEQVVSNPLNADATALPATQDDQEPIELIPVEFEPTPEQKALTQVAMVLTNGNECIARNVYGQDLPLTKQQCLDSQTNYKTYDVTMVQR